MTDQERLKETVKEALRELIAEGLIPTQEALERLQLTTERTAVIMEDLAAAVIQAVNEEVLTEEGLESLPEPKSRTEMVPMRVSRQGVKDAIPHKTGAEITAEQLKHMTEGLARIPAAEYWEREYLLKDRTPREQDEALLLRLFGAGYELERSGRPNNRIGLVSVSRDDWEKWGFAQYRYSFFPTVLRSLRDRGLMEEVGKYREEVWRLTEYGKQVAEAAWRIGGPDA